MAPSRQVAETTWTEAVDELVETLRTMIRIPSVNPPSTRRPRRRDARWRAHRATLLEAAGLEPEILEPVPGRGSVHARLRGDGTGGEPLLLLSHLDVVPAPPDRWTPRPFAADLVDGYIYGRGAVDMKAMVAMELGVVRLLAAEARAAGLDPARDPIPGLRRDVLFTCTADEEAGGIAGAKWIAEHRPDWLRAAGALNECGGVVGDDRRTAPLPDPGRREGFRRRTASHVSGTWGHGSMPREDNAAVLAASRHRAARRPGPDAGDAGDAPASSTSPRPSCRPRRASSCAPCRATTRGAPRRPSTVACDPMYARALRALAPRHPQPGRRRTPASSTT